jgi:copper(I)-binding protein
MVLLLAASLGGCGTPPGPSIETEDVWSRPAKAMTASEQGSEGGMGMAGTGAVFMVLSNKGDEPDRLVGGTTDVAKVVEIHETVMEGEVMKMQMLADGLQIPAGGEVVLKPGSYHVMLIGMQQDLEPGDTFKLDLTFEKSGTLTVEPAVRMMP